MCVCVPNVCVLLSHRKNNVMFSFFGQVHVACAATLHMRATCVHMHERGNDMRLLTNVGMFAQPAIPRIGV